MTQACSCHHLVVRLLEPKVALASLRECPVAAFNQHHGIQGIEHLGWKPTDGTDSDDGGVGV